MKEPDQAYIAIGKFGSTFGVRGWLKIQSYMEFGASILDYSVWYIENKDRAKQSLKLQEGKVQSNTILAKISGIDTPEDARQLTDKIIYIPRNNLPPLNKGEYYWSDLKGLTVINKDGAVLGTIIYLMETGSNDVVVVKGTREIAIPYLPGKVILKVDLEKKEMHVDWEPL